MNPFLVLNVPPDASDAVIRTAWLQALQAAPPERDPLRFQAVQEAYTAIKDERSRANWHMTHHEPPAESPLGVLTALVALPGHARVPVPSAFHSLLHACVSAS